MAELSSNLMEKAALQELQEHLGYDAGKAYFLLLMGHDGALDEEFSYSKKYRLLKQLFQERAMAKVRSDGKDLYHYLLLPPSFLSFLDADQHLIGFLERLYFDKHYSLLFAETSQMILRDEKGLTLFLLRYVMREKALLCTGLDKIYLKGYSGKVDVVRSGKLLHKRVGVFDQEISFDFSVVQGIDSEECVGLFSRGGRAYELEEELLQIGS